MVTWSSMSRSIRPMALSWSSSALRSCITRWARAVSFQSLGSSACAFSSARRALALSKSKMPPQQPDRPLDIFDQLFGFGAHGLVSIFMYGADVAAAAAPRNPAFPARHRIEPVEGYLLKVSASFRIPACSSGLLLSCATCNDISCRVLASSALTTRLWSQGLHRRHALVAPCVGQSSARQGRDRASECSSRALIDGRQIFLEI